jgi:uncharacterized DUF497 family protein
METTILFDEIKRAANLAKHGFDFADLSVAFFAGAVVIPGKFNRLRAVGLFRGQTVTVIFRPLGTEAVSVISMRPASKIERTLL